MRKLLLVFTLCASLAYAPYTMAEIVEGGTSFGSGPDISASYLKQARLYREQGRFELSRQSYVQALSTCRSNSSLEIIKRELAGIELLIRTMR